MTEALTIELPDELKQQLVAQAQHLNISVDSLVAHTIMFWFAAEAASSISPGASVSQASVGLASDESIQQSLIELFEALRNAHLAQAATVEVTANPTTLEWLKILQSLGFVAGIQQPADPSNGRIQFVPNPVHVSQSALLDEAIARFSLLRNRGPANLSPKLASVVQGLKSPDPAVRKSALKELGAQYRDSR